MEAKTISKAYFISTACFALVVLFSTICLCIDCDSKKWMSLNVFITTLAILPLIVFRIAVEESYKSQIETLKQQHQDEVCFWILVIYSQRCLKSFDKKYFIYRIIYFYFLKVVIKYQKFPAIAFGFPRRFRDKIRWSSNRKILIFLQDCCSLKIFMTYFLNIAL